MNIINIAYAASEAGKEAAVENSGVLGTLGIDLGLFIAQLVNFGIILFVLWKWVLPVVGKKLTERAEKIQKSLQDAEDITKEKEEFSKWRNEQMVNARHEASVIIAAAQADALKLKDETLKFTKEEQEKIMAQAKRQMAEEKSQMMSSAKSELADLVTMATEKVVRQKMDSKKDEEIIKEMLKDVK